MVVDLIARYTEPLKLTSNLGVGSSGHSVVHVKGGRFSIMVPNALIQVGNGAADLMILDGIEQANQIATTGNKDYLSLGKLVINSLAP